MNPYELLKTELSDSAYANMTNMEATVAINAKTITRLHSFFINERTVAASEIVHAAASSANMTSAIVAAGVSLELQALSSPAVHSGSETEQNLKAELFRQARVRYLSDGLDIGVQATRDQIDAIASLNPTGMIAAFASALKAMGYEEVKWTLVHLGIPEVHEGEITKARSI